MQVLSFRSMVEVQLLEKPRRLQSRFTWMFAGYYDFLREKVSDLANSCE